MLINACTEEETCLVHQTQEATYSSRTAHQVSSTSKHASVNSSIKILLSCIVGVAWLSMWPNVSLSLPHTRSVPFACDAVPCTEQGASAVRGMRAMLSTKASAGMQSCNRAMQDLFPEYVPF